MLPEEIRKHFIEKQGWCYPDWHAIGEWIGKEVPKEQREDFWTQATREWGNLLRLKLGDSYHFHESDHFLMLSPGSEPMRQEIGELAEFARTHVHKNLDGFCREVRAGKDVILFFSNVDELTEYAAEFYSEGSHPLSLGICLFQEGFRHYVFCLEEPGAMTGLDPDREIGELESAQFVCGMVHEFTHGMLGDLPLPMWLHEGMALWMEDQLYEGVVHRMTAEDLRQHQLHWNRESIQNFWSGVVWDTPGDDFNLSFSLAHILISKMQRGLEPTPEEWKEFLTKAYFADAGESACQSIFECSLGDVAEDFLGRGDWLPEPAVWGRIKRRPTAG